jgi:uncharacterized membrane protein
MTVITGWTKGLVMAIAVVLSSALPALAQQNPDAMLYELSEDMRQTSTHRLATSALAGFAFQGSTNPLCPGPDPAPSVNSRVS